MFKHRVFLSFHHGKDGDRNAGSTYRDEFIRLLQKSEGIIESTSVRDGDIDPSISTRAVRRWIRERHLCGTTVTIVLIGPEAWSRKHVDWEISASIEESQSGLMGVFLPHHADYRKNKYNPHIIPPRLFYNVKNGYATLRDWSKKPSEIRRWIEEAFEQSQSSTKPNNDYPPFKNNLRGKAWGATLKLQPREMPNA